MKPLLLLILAMALSNALHAQSQPQWRLKKIDFGQVYIEFNYSGDHKGAVGHDWLHELLKHPQGYFSIIQDINPHLQYDEVVYQHPSGANQVHKTRMKQVMDTAGQIIWRRYFAADNPSDNANTTDTFDYANGKLVRTANSGYTGGGIVGGGEITYYHYNAEGLADTVEMTSGTSKDMKYVTWNVYDTAGNLTWSQYNTMYGYPLPTIQTFTRDYYIYDTLQQLTAHYVYGGHPVTILQLLESYEYEYDTDGNRVVEKIMKQEDGTVYYTYHNTYINKVKTQEYVVTRRPGRKQEDSLQNYFIYDANGLPQEIRVSLYDTALKQWTQPFTNTRFYYEIFWPVKVSNTKTQQADVTIYPSPATDIITISANFKQAQALKASITDMQGRAIMQWSEAPTQQYARTIPLAGLSAGIYILRLEGEKEHAVRQFVVK